MNNIMIFSFFTQSSKPADDQISLDVITTNGQKYDAASKESDAINLSHQPKNVCKDKVRINSSGRDFNGVRRKNLIKA